MEFFWWGLTARHAACAVEDGQPQVEVHLAGLKQAVKQAGEQWRLRLRLALDATLLFSSFAPLAPAVTGGLATVSAFRQGPSLAHGVRQAVRSPHSIIDDACQTTALRHIDLGLHRKARTAVVDEAQIFALITEILPLAVVVEDAQHLDTPSIDLLKGLLRNEAARGLIVLAVKTDIPVPADDRHHRALESWLTRAAKDRQLTTLELTPLPPGDLLELALANLRPTDPPPDQFQRNLTRVVAAAQGLPGRLQDLLTSTAVKNALLTDEDLPHNLESIRREDSDKDSFRRLPAPARTVLAAIAVHGPATVTHWLLPPPTSSRDQPTAAPSVVDPDGLTAARNTGWIHTDGIGITRFRSHRLYHATKACLSEELTPQQHRALLDTLTRRVKDAHDTDEWAELPPDARESLLTTITETAPHSHEPEPSLVAELLRLRRVTGRGATEEDLLATLENRLKDGAPAPLLIVATAEALFDAGHAQRALDLLTDELRRLTAKYGEGSAATILPMHNLALAWAALAQARGGQPDSQPYFDHAIAIYQEVLRLRLRYLKPGDKQIPDTRWELAELLAADYRYGRAIEEGSTCAREMQDSPAYGPNHPDTLATRAAVATWIGRAGYPTTARDLYQTLLPDLIRVLGPHDPRTLIARDNHALATGKGGDPATARDLYTALLPDMIGILGPHDPRTLTTKGLLADMTARASDDPATARDLYIALLPDMIQVLGPHDPRTLQTRSHVASWTGHAGDPATARDLYTALLPDMIRVLGPKDPVTLACKDNVDYWTEESSRSS